jgi:hypothetical protein
MTPGGSSTSHIYTQTIHIIQRKENLEVRAVPRLCDLYPDICPTTKEKARKPLRWVSTIQEIYNKYALLPPDDGQLANPKHVTSNVRV